ncbi:MAG: hypothetical protein KVP17_001725 [Porospora cf. gigantea B]|uniref:uncharacterized protein n=1 Tax=Porospora cf. gigantea B TaxID=2853592 RepID=UPI00357183CB|nr:MAG: hypothetical protein KVP17_001725 [Porospora cf. gigantea B]
MKLCTCSNLLDRYPTESTTLGEVCTDCQTSSSASSRDDALDLPVALMATRAVPSFAVHDTGDVIDILSDPHCNEVFCMALRKTALGQNSRIPSINTAIKQRKAMIAALLDLPSTPETTRDLSNLSEDLTGWEAAMTVARACVRASQLFARIKPQLSVSCYQFNVDRRGSVLTCPQCPFTCQSFDLSKAHHAVAHTKASPLTAVAWSSDTSHMLCPFLECADLKPISWKRYGVHLALKHAPQLGLHETSTSTILAIDFISRLRLRSVVLVLEAVCQMRRQHVAGDAVRCILSDVMKYKPAYHSLMSMNPDAVFQRCQLVLPRGDCPASTKPVEEEDLCQTQIFNN